ncbi:MAG: glycosyltransferase [Deltaproteobacteria bacterium]|jgi:glycosyltransferase involved in cell wall biosynthesis|nr:glycosyltransferase [Deltaproteobacteria bacterium]
MYSLTGQSAAGFPFFTIITATRNSAATLPRLLESLATQTCRDFELIIQDGASTDGTVAVAEAWRERLPALSLASEPDTGIYDAWNKALPRIQGEWALFLGADDQLDAADVLERCFAALRDAPDTVQYASGMVQTVAVGGDPVSIWQHYKKNVNKHTWRAMPFPHQALFHQRSLFSRDRFDANLRIAADFDFVCRTWTEKNGSLVLPFVVTRMRRGGISDSPASTLRMRWENAVVAARYFEHVWTASCVTGLAKGCLLWLVCALLGKRAPGLLDAGRRLRGLPPAWRGL